MCCFDHDHHFSILEYVNDIISVVFEYIALLKSHEPSREFFDELKVGWFVYLSFIFNSPPAVSVNESVLESVGYLIQNNL